MSGSAHRSGGNLAEGSIKYNERNRNVYLGKVCAQMYTMKTRGNEPTFSKNERKCSATFKIEQLKSKGTCMQEKESNMSVQRRWNILCLGITFGISWHSLVIQNSDPQDRSFYLSSQLCKILIFSKM